MNKRRNDDVLLLVRFVQNLSSRRSRQGVYSPTYTPFHCGLAEIPAALDPLSFCSYTIPCLSLHTTNTRQRADFAMDDTSTGCSSCSPSSSTTATTTTTSFSPPAPSPREQLGQEQRYKQLLAREIHCNTVSDASSFMLMNFVETFGKLLQMELQRKLYNLVAKLEQDCSNSLKKKQRKEAIYKVFEDQALTDEPPVVPVSFSTRFYTNLDTNRSQYHDIGSAEKEHHGIMNINTDDSSTTSIMFEAKIQLQLNPSCSLVTCCVTSPGEVKLNYRSERSNIMESINVLLDTEFLYRSIIKECRNVSKLALNGIIGHNSIDNCWVTRRSKSDVDTTKVESPQKKMMKGVVHSTTISSTLPSDSVTHSTVATSEDRSLEEFKKRNALIGKSHGSSLHRLSNSNNEQQAPQPKKLKHKKKQQQQQQQQQPQEKHHQQQHQQQKELGTTPRETKQAINPSSKQTSKKNKKKILKWLIKIPYTQGEVKQKIAMMNRLYN